MKIITTNYIIKVSNSQHYYDNKRRFFGMKLAENIRESAEILGLKISAYTVGANLYHDNEEDSRIAVEKLCVRLI